MYKLTGFSGSASEKEYREQDRKKISFYSHLKAITRRTNPRVSITSDNLRLSKFVILTHCDCNGHGKT